jgi:hypothetical protein
MKTTANFIYRAIIAFSMLAAVCAAFWSNPAWGASVFSGIDEGAGPGGAKPNSDAARAAWAIAASGPITIIDFEAETAGTAAPFSSGGVSFSTSGSFEMVEVDTDNGMQLGFNTTAGGQHHLAVWPSFDSGTTQVIADFASPVNAFGAYFISLESDVSGTVHVLFNDGSAQDFTLPETLTSGVQFWGVADLDADIAQVIFEEQGVAGTRDIYGIDDFQYAVPEPSTLVLVGFGLLGVACWRRNGM